MQLTFIKPEDTCLSNLAPDQKVTSITIEAADLNDFYTALCGFAAQGYYLLNGSLTRDLDQEQWGDKYNNYSLLHFLCVESPDDAALPEELKDVTHVKHFTATGPRYIFMLAAPLPHHALEPFVNTLSGVTCADRAIGFGEDPAISLVPCATASLSIPEATQAELDKLPAPEPQRAGTMTWLAFIDRSTDNYYAGDINVEARWHDVKPIASKDRLANFLKLRGGDPKAPLPEWTMVFDPTSDTFVDMENRILNTFKPTEYMLNATKRDDAAIPDMINVIIDSLTSGDEELKDHFLNWLAYRFQTRKKASTAWVFTGVEGTGKGMLYDKVLRPLFGAEQCRMFTLDNLTDAFNAYAESSLFGVVDEAHVSNDRAGQKLLDKLKNKITEPTVELRKMRTDSYTVKNYCDYIFFSNHRDAMRITDTDRRFTVAPHQSTPMPVPTPEQVDSIGAELQNFADYLFTYDACEKRARLPLNNEHKAVMAENSASQHERFFKALRTANLNYFIECIEEPHHEFTYMRADVQELLHKIISTYCHETESLFFPNADLVKFYAIALGKQQSTRTMAVWLAHNGFPAPKRKPRTMTDKYESRPRGQVIQVELTDEELEEYTNMLKAETSDASNLLPFPRAKDGDNNG